MYDKLIVDLKEDAEWAEANEWETPTFFKDDSGMMAFDYTTRAQINDAETIIPAEKDVVDGTSDTPCYESIEKGREA